MTRRAVALGVAAIAAVGLAACGGSSSSSGDFTSDAEDICNEANDKIADARKSNPPPAELLAKSRPIFADSRKQLAELDPPSDKKAAFDRYLATLGELLVAFGRVGRAVEQKDQAMAVAAVDRLRTLQPQARREAQAAGIPACGR